MLSSAGMGVGPGVVTSYIWHSMDVRSRMAPFFSAAKYMIGPFFCQQKVYDWPHFSGLVYERPHFSDVSQYMHIFFVQKFLRLLVVLVFNELTSIFV